MDWGRIRLDFDLKVRIGGVSISERELRALKTLYETGDEEQAASAYGITVGRLREVKDGVEDAVGRGGFDEFYDIFQQKRMLVENCIRGLRRPSIAVDAVVLRGREVLLVRRGRAPYRGFYALPGGFLEYGETAEEAVKREVLEETGVVAEVVETVGVYSSPNRDPRGHTVSVAFLLRYKEGVPRGGDDSSGAIFSPIGKVPRLAFDHNQILSDALEAAARRLMI